MSDEVAPTSLTTFETFGEENSKKCIIKSKLEKLLKEEVIQQAGQEMMSYIIPGGKVTRHYEHNPELFQDAQQYCFDFSNVEYMSGKFLSKLLIFDRYHRTLLDSPSSISGIREDIYQIFKLTKMDKLFNFYDSNESFINSENYKVRQ